MGYANLNELTNFYPPVTIRKLFQIRSILEVKLEDNNLIPLALVLIKRNKIRYQLFSSNFTSLKKYYEGLVKAFMIFEALLISSKHSLVQNQQWKR